jgi:hypothetical protein
MFSRPIRMSLQTRRNWLIDAAVFAGGIAAALSGIYFLFVPSGGYRSGRNPMYGFTILFGRHTWDSLHTWAGVAMIAAVAIHLAIHWTWVKMMARRTAHALLNKGGKLSRGARLNVFLDSSIGLCFLVCAVSGLHVLLLPSGGGLGGHNLGMDPSLLFSGVTWDLIHTWSGVALIVGVVLHLAIHWRWIKNVTVRFFVSLLPQPESSPVGATR